MFVLRARHSGVVAGVLSDKSCRGDGGGRTVYDAMAPAGTLYTILIPNCVSIKQQLPDTNFNGMEYGWVTWATGVHWKDLLYVDLSAYAGRTVISATIQLWCLDTTGAGFTVDIHEMATVWIDSQATWNNKTTGVAWSTPGLASGVDYLAPLVLQFGKQTLAWNALDVKAPVEAWLSGARTNYGLLLQHLTVSSQKFTYASDVAVDPAKKPYMELVLV